MGMPVPVLAPEGGDDTLSRVVSPDLEVWDLLIMMSKGSDSGI